jgi:hypothetical protein
MICSINFRLCSTSRILIHTRVDIAVVAHRHLEFKRQGA